MDKLLSPGSDNVITDGLILLPSSPYSETRPVETSDNATAIDSSSSSTDSRVKTSEHAKVDDLLSLSTDIKKDISESGTTASPKTNAENILLTLSHSTHADDIDASTADQVSQLDSIDLVGSSSSSKNQKDTVGDPLSSNPNLESNSAVSQEPVPIESERINSDHGKLGSHDMGQQLGTRDEDKGMKIFMAEALFSVSLFTSYIFKWSGFLI